MCILWRHAAPAVSPAGIVRRLPVFSALGLQRDEARRPGNPRPGRGRLPRGAAPGGPQVSEQGISLNHAMFRQELAQHVDAIKRLCAEWGIPRLGTHVTLILRDPANDHLSFLLTDEATLAEPFRVARLLEQEGRR